MHRDGVEHDEEQHVDKVEQAAYMMATFLFSYAGKESPYVIRDRYKLGLITRRRYMYHIGEQHTAV